MTPKHADPRRIRQHAADLDAQVIPLIKRAGDTLNGDGTYNLEGGDFSITCTPMAMVYPPAIQFAFEDIKMLMSAAKSYAEKIDRAGINYRESDRHSAI